MSRRTGGLLAGAVLALVLAALAAGRAVRIDDWPATIEGTDSTPIARWSGPWVGGAALALLVAGLLVFAAFASRPPATAGTPEVPADEAGDEETTRSVPGSDEVPAA